MDGRQHSPPLPLVRFAHNTPHNTHMIQTRGPYHLPTVASDNPECLEILLKGGANPDTPTYDGTTPMHIACATCKAFYHSRSPPTRNHCLSPDALIQTLAVASRCSSKPRLTSTNRINLGTHLSTWHVGMVKLIHPGHLALTSHIAISPCVPHSTPSWWSMNLL